jgi:hypothetical protein
MIDRESLASTGAILSGKYHPWQYVWHNSWLKRKMNRQLVRIDLPSNREPTGQELLDLVSSLVDETNVRGFALRGSINTQYKVQGNMKFRTDRALKVIGLHHPSLLFLCGVVKPLMHSIVDIDICISMSPHWTETALLMEWSRSFSRVSTLNISVLITTAPTESDMSNLFSQISKLASNAPCLTCITMMISPTS